MPGLSSKTGSRNTTVYSLPLLFRACIKTDAVSVKKMLSNENLPYSSVLPSALTKWSLLYIFKSTSPLTTGFLVKACLAFPSIEIPSTALKSAAILCSGIVFQRYLLQPCVNIKWFSLFSEDMFSLSIK